MSSADLAPAEIRCYFVRQRNCLLVRGKFSDLYMDYYLHLMQHEIKHPDRLDMMLKEAVAGMALHLASRPHDEICAWTINLNDPLMNLFVTGGTKSGRVVGRIFTEDVRNTGRCLFITQTTRFGLQPQQSMIEFHGTDMLAAIEQFYSQSEQRRTRIFRLADEDFVQISAEPDADEDWLNSLTDDSILTLDSDEQLSLLETRHYIFDCGCTVDRLFPMLMRLSDEDMEYVFADGAAKITCPRCGAKFDPTRETFDAWKARQPA
jgi:molecular chaperone Hsp33